MSSHKILATTLRTTNLPAANMGFAIVPQTVLWLIKVWFSASIPIVYLDGKNRHLLVAAKRQTVKKPLLIFHYFNKY
jgi:hypothetical protein